MVLEKNIVLKSIQCFKELIAQRNFEEHYIVFSLEEFNGRKANNLFVWKLIGLTITDGDLSSILKSKRIKNITFRGLTLETAYPVFSTSLRSLGKAKVYGFKQNVLGQKRHYYIV